MKYLDKLNTFYRSLEEISFVNTSLDVKREELKSLIEGFDHKIQTFQIDQSLLEQNDELGTLLKSTAQKLKDSSSVWVENFHKLLEREKFRSDLENYFIVMIFGKVKAGKSSLGNFIAKNNTTAQKPLFFKYDEAGKETSIKELQEIDENDEFATNNLECTTEIQGFRLGGLAWIDTPGLGSMVEENGALAKAYIQGADYVIFPTSSAEPERLEVLEAIQELLEYNKPIAVTITRSDTKERQRGVDGKLLKDEYGKILPPILVNKSPEVRAKQESSFKKSLSELLGQDCTPLLGEVFSVSVFTAQKALDNNDEKLFEESNMPKFYELMTEVVQKKASQLKTSTPYNGLVSFIDNELLGDKSKENSLSVLESSLAVFDNKIAEAYKQFEIIQQNLNSDIESEIDFIISQYMNEIDKDNAKEKFSLIDKELSENIMKLTSQNISQIVTGFASSMQHFGQSLNNLDSYEIKDEYKEIKVKYKDRDLLNIVSFGVWGRSHKTIKESVYVGDNKDEIILQFKQDRIQAYKESTGSLYEQVMREFFEPLKLVSTNIKSEIKQLQQNMETYKRQLTQEKA